MEPFAYICIKIKVMEVKACIFKGGRRFSESLTLKDQRQDHLQHCQSEVCDCPRTL